MCASRWARAPAFVFVLLLCCCRLGQCGARLATGRALTGLLLLLLLRVCVVPDGVVLAAACTGSSRVRGSDCTAQTAAQGGRGKGGDQEMDEVLSFHWEKEVLFLHFLSPAVSCNAGVTLERQNWARRAQVSLQSARLRVCDTIAALRLRAPLHGSYLPATYPTRLGLDRRPPNASAQPATHSLSGRLRAGRSDLHSTHAAGLEQQQHQHVRCMITGQYGKPAPGSAAGLLPRPSSHHLDLGRTRLSTSALICCCSQRSRPGSRKLQQQQHSTQCAGLSAPRACDQQLPPCQQQRRQRRQAPQRRQQAYKALPG